MTLNEPCGISRKSFSLQRPRPTRTINPGEVSGLRKVNSGGLIAEHAVDHDAISMDDVL